MQIYEVTLKDGDVITVNGIHFMKLKDKLMKVTLTKDNALEIRNEVTSEEIIHPNGKKDCIIHVPCLGLNAKALDQNRN